MTKIIGLTGGIGSGKTTIAKFFEAEEILVYIADLEAKKIMQENQTIELIVKSFGKSVVKNNIIDSKILSALVFNNPEKLKILNAIIHPLVKVHFENWILQHLKNVFVIKESAILFESGSYHYCDKIITVYCSEETRIKRVMLRDQCSRTDVLDRIKNQWTDAQKIEKSDFIIENENLESAKIQFKEIFSKLNKL